MIKTVSAVLFWLLVLAGCASTPDESKQRAQLHLQIGTSLLGQGNYPGALKELLAAEKLDPKNHMVQNNLGLAFWVRARHKEAEKHLRQALELEPKYTDARNNLGRLLTELHRIDEAIALLKVAVEDLTYPSPEKSHYNLGFAYFKKGHFKSAKDTLLKSLEINRQNCPTMLLYGRSRLELRDYSLAAEALDQAIDLCKGIKTDEPHYFSGLAYVKLGNREKAMARFEEQVALLPNGDNAEKARQAIEVLKK